MDRLEQNVILLFTDLKQAVGSIDQNIFDTSDEERTAFTVGYVIVHIAVEILVSKGLKKLKVVKLADEVVDAAGDLFKHTDDASLLKQTQPYTYKSEVNDLAEHIAANGPNVGFLQIWRSKCLKGIYISRAVASVNAKFVSFDTDLNNLVPKYDFVDE